MDRQAMRRRKPTVVLWGGRPGIDRQFGSDYDLLHAKLCRDFAQHANTVKLMILPPLQRPTRTPDTFKEA